MPGLAAMCMNGLQHRHLSVVLVEMIEDADEFRCGDGVKIRVPDPAKCRQHHHQKLPLEVKVARCGGLTALLLECLSGFDFDAKPARRHIGRPARCDGRNQRVVFDDLVGNQEVETRLRRDVVQVAPAAIRPRIPRDVVIPLLGERARRHEMPNGS